MGIRPSVAPSAKKRCAECVWCARPLQSICRCSGCAASKGKIIELGRSPSFESLLWTICPFRGSAHTVRQFLRGLTNERVRRVCFCAEARREPEALAPGRTSYSKPVAGDLGTHLARSAGELTGLDASLIFY